MHFILDFITYFRSIQWLCKLPRISNSLMMASIEGPKHVGVIDQ